MSQASEREIETIYTSRPAPYRRDLDFAPFVEPLHALGEDRVREISLLVEPMSIDHVSGHLQAGRLTCHELVLYFVHEIMRRDVGVLNSVQELNPDALVAAALVDVQLAQGHFLGPLHGSVTLIKDNIGAGPSMHTSAGAVVMRDARPREIADVVTALTDAGVVILGKAAMSEWAYFLATPAPSGWSALGGQIKNPHGRHLVGGSSTGSAVAVAAGLCSFAIGTETLCSIIDPASASGVCGFKPSLGLVSARGVIPLTTKHDVVGPIARSIDDIGLVMDVLAPSLSPTAADVSTLEGLRVGIYAENVEQLGHVVDRLEAAGAVVGVADFGEWDAEREIKIFDVLDYGMKNELADYLRSSNAPIATLSDVIAFNDAHNDAIPFGQDVIIKANANQLTPAEYDQVAEENSKWANDKIQNVLDGGDFDVIASVGSAISRYYATAGLPAVCVAVPQELWAPTEDRAPMGVTFVSGKRNDAWLIQLARLVERALHAPI